MLPTLPGSLPRRETQKTRLEKHKERSRQRGRLPQLLQSWRQDTSPERPDPRAEVESHLAWVLREPIEADRSALYDVSIDSGPHGRVVSRMEVPRSRSGKPGTNVPRQGTTLPVDVSKRLEECCSVLLQAGKRSTARELVRRVYEWNVSRTHPAGPSESSLSNASDRTVPFTRFVSSQTSLREGSGQTSPSSREQGGDSYGNGYGLLPASRSMPPPSGQTSSNTSLWRIPIPEGDRRVLEDDAYPLAAWRSRAGQGGRDNSPQETVFLTQNEASETPVGTIDVNDTDEAWKRWMEVRAKARAALIAGMHRQQLHREGNAIGRSSKQGTHNAGKYRFIDVFEAVDQALRRMQAKSGAGAWTEEDAALGEPDEEETSVKAPPPLGSSEAWLQWTALHATKRILMLHSAGTESSAAEEAQEEEKEEKEEDRLSTSHARTVLVSPSAPPGSPPLVTLGRRSPGGSSSSVASLAHWVGPDPVPINVGALTLAQRGPDLAAYYQVWGERWAALFQEDEDEDGDPSRGVSSLGMLPLPVLRRRLCGEAGWSTVARMIAAARDGAATCIQRHFRGHATRWWTRVLREEACARRSAEQSCLRWAWDRLDAARQTGPAKRRLRGAWWRWRAFWRLQQRKNEIFRTAFWPMYVWKRSLLVRKATERKAATLRSVWQAYRQMHCLRRWNRFTVSDVPWRSGVSRLAAAQWYRRRRESRVWDIWRGRVAEQQVSRRVWLQKWTQVGPLVMENAGMSSSGEPVSPLALARGEPRLLERVILHAWRLYSKHVRQATAIGRAFGYPTRFARVGADTRLPQEWIDRVESSLPQAAWSDADASAQDDTGAILLVDPLSSLPGRVTLCSVLANDVVNDGAEMEMPRQRMFQSLSFEPFLTSLERARNKAMVDANRVQLASFLRLARPVWAAWTLFVHRTRRERVVESLHRLARIRRVWRAWISSRQLGLSIPGATHVDDTYDEEKEEEEGGKTLSASQSHYPLQRRKDPLEAIESERVWRAASEARLSEWQSELAFSKRRARSWRERRRNESWTRREWAKLRQWSEWANAERGVEDDEVATDITKRKHRSERAGSVGGKSADSEDDDDESDGASVSSPHRDENAATGDRLPLEPSERRENTSGDDGVHTATDIPVRPQASMRDEEDGAVGQKRRQSGVQSPSPALEASDGDEDLALDAALKNVASEAQAMRENRAVHLHDALVRGFSALEHKQRHYWLRTCFKALAKAVRVRRVISRQNRARLQNWLRICHRLLWFDRNAPKFRALWLRRQAFRNMQRAVEWTARNASDELSPEGLRRQQKRLGVLSVELSRDDIGDTPAFLASPRGIFLRWRELALQRKGWHVTFRIFGGLRDVRRLFRAFRAWSSTLRRHSTEAVVPTAIGAFPQAEEPSPGTVNVLDPDLWGTRWAQIAPPRGWEWFFPQGGVWWEHDALRRLRLAGEELLEVHGVDAISRSLGGTRRAKAREQEGSLVSAWCDRAWRALQSSRRQMFFREERGFTNCDLVHRYLVWASSRPSCYLGWLHRHRKVTRAMQRKDNEQRARMTRMESLRGSGSRGSDRRGGTASSAAAVREAPRVFGAQFDREEGAHAAASAAHKAHAMSLAGAGSQGGSRRDVGDESEWTQETSSVPRRSEWMLVQDRSMPAGYVLEAREEEMRRRLAVERELLRVAREERVFAECERMLVYPGVGGSAGTPFRIVVSPVEHWIGVRVDLTEEGGIAGVQFVIGRGLHPSAVQSAAPKKASRPPQHAATKQPAASGTHPPRPLHQEKRETREGEHQPRVSASVRRSSVSLARRASLDHASASRLHVVGDSSGLFPWRSVWEDPLRWQREAARTASEQVTEQAGSDSDPTLWTSGLWGGRPKDGMLLRVAEPIGTGLRAPRGLRNASGSHWFGLARDERIVGVEVQAATSLGRIRFFTSAGHVSPWIGKNVTGARYVLGDLTLFREATHARRHGYPLPMTRTVPRGPYVCGFHGTASDGVVSSLGLVTRWDRSINPLQNCWSENLLPVHALSRAQFRSHRFKALTTTANPGHPRAGSDLQSASATLDEKSHATQPQWNESNRLSRQELVFLSKLLVKSARTIVEKVPFVHPRYDRDDCGQDEVPSGDDGDDGDDGDGEENVGDDGEDLYGGNEGESADSGSQRSKRNRRGTVGSVGSIFDLEDSKYNVSTLTEPHGGEETFLTATGTVPTSPARRELPSSVRVSATRVAPLRGPHASSWLESLGAELDGTMTWEADVAVEGRSSNQRRHNRPRRHSTVSSIGGENRSEMINDLDAGERDTSSEEQLRVLLQLRESRLEEALERSEKLVWRILEGRGVASDSDRCQTAATEERLVPPSAEQETLQENRVAAFGIARWLLLAQMRGLPRLFPKKKQSEDDSETQESPEAALARRRRLLLCAREMTRRGMQLVDRGRRVVASAAFGVNPPPDALNSARFGVRLVRARVRTIWRGHRLQQEGWNTIRTSRELRTKAEATGPPLPSYLSWRRWIEDSTCDVRGHMRQDPSAGYRLAMASEGVRRVKALTALRTRPVGLPAQQERKLRARIAHRRLQELRDVTLREEREEEERAFEEGRDVLGIADDMSEAFSEVEEPSELIGEDIDRVETRVTVDPRREEIRRRSMAAVDDALSSSSASGDEASVSSSEEEDSADRSRRGHSRSGGAIRESFVSSSLQKALQRQQSTGISRIFG